MVWVGFPIKILVSLQFLKVWCMTAQVISYERFLSRLGFSLQGWASSLRSRGKVGGLRHESPTFSFAVIKFYQPSSYLLNICLQGPGKFALLIYSLFQISMTVGYLTFIWSCSTIPPRSCLIPPRFERLPPTRGRTASTLCCCSLSHNGLNLSLLSFHRRRICRRWSCMPFGCMAERKISIAWPFTWAQAILF